MKLEHKDTVPKIAEYEDSFSCLRLLKSSEQGYIYRKNCVNLSELVQEEKTKKNGRNIQFSRCLLLGV